MIKEGWDVSAAISSVRRESRSGRPEENPAVRQASGAAASDLAQIHQPDVNLVVWRRAPNSGIAGVAAALVNTPGFDACLHGTPAVLGFRLRSVLKRAARERPRARLRFAADLSALVRRFATLTGSTSIHLHLEGIDDDACSLFHVDRRTLRLLTAYHGDGTEWLPEAAVNRAALGAGSNDAICRDRSQIRRLRPFWVGLFKGSAHGDDRFGIVHRSPPIRRRGGRRLLLRLDPSADIVTLHD